MVDLFCVLTDISLSFSLLIGRILREKKNFYLITQLFNDMYTSLGKILSNLSAYDLYYISREESKVQGLPRPAYAADRSKQITLSITYPLNSV